MLFPRFLTVSLLAVLAVTVWLVGCVEEVASPPPLQARVKVLLPQTPEEVDHGWLTIDRDDANRRRMTWDGQYLESEPVTLLPGVHHFLVTAVDAAGRELYRGEMEDTIPDDRLDYTVVIQMYEVLVYCLVEPEALDFGDVLVNAPVTRSFTITNLPSSNSPLSGTVDESCADFTVLAGGGNYTLAPGDYREVLVEFRPLALGTRECTITTGTSCVDVAVTGNGIGTAAQISPASLDFGSVPVGESVQQSFVITNTGSADLPVNVQEDCPAFSLVSGGGPDVLPPEGELTVVVAFAPPEPGDYACTITTGEQTAGVPCSGSGQALEPECLVTPTMLDFGTVTVGEPVEQTFLVENIGQVDLPIDVAAGCGDFTVVSGAGPRVLAAGESLTAIVVFEPAAAGEQSCLLDVGTPCQGVTCSGTGDPPPACEVSPTVLDFGDLVVGETRDLSFTITNTGGGVLSGVVSELCPQFDSVSGFGYFELPAGQSRLVTLRYAPDFEGYHSCTVNTGTGLCDEVSCTGTASSAVCFDFDGGAGRQGWYLHHLLTYPSLRIITDLADSTNFRSNWSDDVNYPSAYGDDPTGDQQGSFWLDTTVDGLPIITYPPQEDDFWLAHIRSPDLDYYPAWQEAVGFSARILDHLSWAGEGFCYVSIHFTIWDEDELRERSWPSVTAPAVTVDYWGEFSVYFDYPDMPANWHLRRVFVQVWGTIGDQYQGGVYLDEICPITAEKSAPFFGRRQGKVGELTLENLAPPR